VARELQAAGWPNARALTGGWTAWRAAGMPVEQKPGNEKGEKEKVDADEG
jgi:3-mercaptopyruvate sulfurtransferase SseA